MAENKKGKITLEDLGYGSGLQSKKRFINKNGSLNVERPGFSNWTLYHQLTEASWIGFFMYVIFYYVLVNSIFAIVYLLIGVESFGGVDSGKLVENFSQTFFFSVQTFTTVGYGIATGLLFSRFSRPVAQILYSKNAVIAPFQNGKAFMIRVANTRDNKIMNLEAKISATWHEEVNGEEIRKYALLKLERDRVFLFPLSWTIVHPLNEESPFYTKGEEELEKMNVEFLVMLEGYDESYNQMIYSNTSYTCEEIIWNAKFKIMFHSNNEKGTILELDKINNIELIDEIL
jgi:inward rectifier potassium channel